LRTATVDSKAKFHNDKLLKLYALFTIADGEEISEFSYRNVRSSG